MSEKPSKSSNPLVWTAVLFLGSMVGTVYPVWRFNQGHRLWLGTVLFIALFACSWMLGFGANRDAIKHGLADGLRTLIETGARWLLAVFGILLVIGIGCGWPWFQRAIIPLAAGLVAGLKWPRPETKPGDSAKSDKEEPPPMDFWKT